MFNKAGQSTLGPKEKRSVMHLMLLFLWPLLMGLLASAFWLALSWQKVGASLPLSVRLHSQNASLLAS